MDYFHCHFWLGPLNLPVDSKQQIKGLVALVWRLAPAKPSVLSKHSDLLRWPFITLWLFNIAMEHGPFIDGFTY